MSNRPTNIVPVVLAGGAGTRFWPLSRRDRPKHALSLRGAGGLGEADGAAADTDGAPRSLLAATLVRCRALAPLAHVRVVVGADQLDGLLTLVPELAAARLLGEPVARNTAAAVAYAVGDVLADYASTTIVAVLPADHVIEPVDAFVEAIAKATDVAREEDAIVTLGVRPTSPATGYGYIETTASGDGAARSSPVARWLAVARFVEKPERAVAEAFVASGRHYWNAGIFVATAEAWSRAFADCLPAHAAMLRALAALERHRPDRAARDGAAPSAAGVDTGEADRVADPVAAKHYPALEPISLDYGLMERLAPARLRCVPATFEWDDLGSYESLAARWRGQLATRASGAGGASASADDGGGTLDQHGNISRGESVVVDGANNLVITDAGLVAVVGLDDVIVVRDGDAVLVCRRGAGQSVGRVPKLLDERGDNTHT